MWRTAFARVRRVDLAIAGGFVAFALIEERAVGMPGNWWPYTLAGFATLVALRRAAPLVVMLANAVAPLRIFYRSNVPELRLWQVVAILVAAYTVGQLVGPWGPGRRERIRGITGVGLVLASALVLWDADRSDPMAAFFFTFAPYALGVAVAGQVRRLAEAAADRAAIRERHAREAVREERVRIARELHDMVAHSVTVMVIQAGVVRRRHEAGLGVDPELLRTIEVAGREAVGELRRTLALLRGDSNETASPPAGLDRLDELVAQVREAGLDVRLHRVGESATLLPAVDLSAYRIVQEALTNVLKHAGPARVTVQVSYQADGLSLSVMDDGRGSAGTGEAGHGLVGMRERVALFGGELAVGHRPEGGFAVHARLPVLTTVVP
ncbi:sensor histidine kinase [Micromonospora sp. SL4-19]|uniref:sensor histidine kinase n=1 Tax=Micromonospora sp. SL4-19 TaxID=3399129 RepID=UPI003A4E3E30